MDATTFLRDWVRRHPLREPEGCDRAGFTNDVMRRIAAERRPVPRPLFSRLLWPSLALGAAVACALFVLIPSQPEQAAEQAVADQVAADAYVLSALGELDEGMVPADDEQGVRLELETLDRLTLGQTAGEDGRRDG